MTRALFTQTIDTAFEDKVGSRGADMARFHQYRKELTPWIADIAKTPVPEVASMFKLPAAEDDLAEIETLATRIAEHFTHLVIAGMGGSSLGGEVLAHLRKPGGLSLRFLDNIDPHSFALLADELPWKTTAFLLISKSGNTVETHAHTAAILQELKQRGIDAGKHCFVITIPNGNPLHKLAQEMGMPVIAHDKDLCGRFSILSAVGLVPAAAVGVDIRALRAGAHITLTENMSGKAAPAADAAALHSALIDKHNPMQVMMYYSDRLGGLATWHRQCWSESLGKRGKGTTPIPSRGATDQHSQLQLYLEGPGDKYFTSLILDTSGQGAAIDYPGTADARLSYLGGHTFGDLVMAEQRATNDTLIAKGCPLRTFTMPVLDEATMGALLMHFTLEVTFTAALFNVNAFDQPAVEAGKRLALDYLAGKDASAA